MDQLSETSAEQGKRVGMEKGLAQCWGWRSEERCAPLSKATYGDDEHQ